MPTMQLEIDEPMLCSESVVHLAEEVRGAWHPHLEGARVVYVFRPKGPMVHGKRRLGQARKLSAINALLANADFVIELAYDGWMEIDELHHRALLDHELCHCTVKLDDETGEVKGWTTRPHDLEDFSEVAQRHGLVWDFQREHARRTRERQLELFGKEAGPE